MSGTSNCLIASCGTIIVLLIIILIPLTFSYVEYYEYGLDQRKLTGSVDVTRVYSSGRYALGPDHRFIKYQADAHYLKMDALSVFSAASSNGSNATNEESIGLEFLVDVDLTFFLIEDEIGLLHKELSSNYRNVIESRARDAIKSSAIFVTFTEYFQDRMAVERRFREAIEQRWSEAPALHCELDQFHLGRIQIPDSVAKKQLEARVQNERNSQEEFLQEAQVERQLTEVEVNEINLRSEKVLRTARAEASLILSQAKSSADRIKAQAQTNGTSLLSKAAGISTQEQKSAFAYIRTLMTRRSPTAVGVSYLSADSVVRTSPVTTTTTTATANAATVNDNSSN